MSDEPRSPLPDDPSLGAAERAAVDVNASPASTPATWTTALWKRPLARAVYWTPVLVPMVLFAQVAFLGLRPALCEKRRLEAAEGLLDERRDRDRELAQTIWSHARARNDGVFLERQRRLREQPSDLARDGDAEPTTDAPESAGSTGTRR